MEEKRKTNESYSISLKFSEVSVQNPLRKHRDKSHLPSERQKCFNWSNFGVPSKPSLILYLSSSCAILHQELVKLFPSPELQIFKYTILCKSQSLWLIVIQSHINFKVLRYQIPILELQDKFLSSLISVLKPQNIRSCVILRASGLIVIQAHVSHKALRYQIMCQSQSIRVYYFSVFYQV